MAQLFYRSKPGNLIDTALKNNQELKITLQEIEIAKNDIRLRQAPLLPTVGARFGAGVGKGRPVYQPGCR